MKKKPIVTICIPTFNRQNYILKAIESALNQKDDSFKILVVDDGSSDNTAEIVNSINDVKLTFIKKNHSNAPDTRNLCIQTAESDFILWLDSDDILEPDLLPRFRTLLKTYPDIDICYGDIEPFGDINFFQQKIIKYADYYHKNNKLISEMVYGNKIPNPGTFIRKSLFDKVGLYKTEFRRAHDYEFWVRCAPQAIFKHIGGSSLKWRWHDNNMSTGNMVYDTSFEAAILTQLITTHSLEMLFPNLEWGNTESSNFIANCELARMYFHWKDENLFIKHIENALLAIVKNLILPKNRLEKILLFKKIFKTLSISNQNHIFTEIIKIFDKMQLLEEMQSQQSSLSRHNEFLQPLVSVIIPTFNRPNQLLNAVKSVLRQTYTAFEVIVINDCGIDVSKILKIFADQRIFYISHYTNKGLAATRNTGIQAARGKYIAYLDDDDEFFPNHLQTLVEALEGSKFKVAYTDGIKCLYEEHNSSTVLKHKFVEHSSDFDPHRLLCQNYIPVLCMMHAKSCLDHTGFFDEKLNVHEDWDLWIRLSRIFPFLHIKKNTCAYKIIINSNKNLSTSKGIDFITTMQTIYRKNLHHNMIPNIINIQKKILESLICASFNGDQTYSISIGDNFEIFINGILTELNSQK